MVTKFVAPLLAALALAVLPVASASGAYSIRTARFHATVSGHQHVAWTLNQSSMCGTLTGSGEQTFDYHQKHRVTLVFWSYVSHDGPPEVNVAGPTAASGIPITGSVTRSGTLASTPSGKCEPGHPIGPPQAPPAPDCGTQHYNGFLRPSWYRPQDYPAAPGDPIPLNNAFVLDEESPFVQFLHCPFNGPLIMNRAINKLLPEKIVFGSRRRINLSTSLHKIYQDQRVGTGVRADTTVAWTLHLTRIGH